MKKLLMYILFIGITAMIIINAENSIIYAQNGLIMCYEIIIPSLFPFFVCSGLLVYSGFSEILSKLLTPVMLPFFRINGSGSAAFVLGIISGYPLGAITACSLYENKYLSKTETERLLAFCNNSGPLFILGSVGIALYKSPTIGWSLYLSHILAAITVGFLFRFYKSKNHIGFPSRLNQPERSIGEIFSIVLKNSVTNILLVCGTIIFFSVIANLIVSQITTQAWFTALFLGVIEFVTGTVAVANSNLDIAYKLILSSFIVGFAGLSVHFQVMSVVATHHLSLIPYILGKFLHGIFAGVYMFIILKFIPIDSPVFSQHKLGIPFDINGAFAVSSFYIISTVLIISVICLIIFFISSLLKRFIDIKKIPQKNHY